ncbi:MAG: hypothetical protein IJP70_04435 [Bacteroidales bacterium]|nr:hypothetical protein [Bacteroidales bacterium]
MKKTYISPKAEVVSVNLQDIIASSVKLGGNYNGSDEIQAGSYRNSLWGDDE